MIYYTGSSVHPVLSVVICTVDSTEAVLQKALETGTRINNGRSFSDKKKKKKKKLFRKCDQNSFGLE